MTEIEELENRIIEACEKVKEMGYKILPDETLKRNERCCLIGAAMVLSGKEFPTWTDGEEYLHVTHETGNLIASGYDNYDGSRWGPGMQENEYWKLGHKLRNIYS